MELTQYVETNMLLAAMNGDSQELMKLAGELLPGEVADLLDAAQMFTDALKIRKWALTHEL